MATDDTLRDFTVDEYHRMADVGILHADERLELLDGRIVFMSPIGKRHWMVHAVLVAYLNTTFGGRLIVGQGSFPLGDRNEPQPDIAIIDASPVDYGTKPFQASDLRVVIELAESSLPKDMGPKARLYGRFRIPDYVVVDLGRDVLHHHTLPNDVGFGSVVVRGRGDVFRFAAFPNIDVAADAFLAPAAQTTGS